MESEVLQTICSWPLKQILEVLEIIKVFVSISISFHKNSSSCLTDYPQASAVLMLKTQASRACLLPQSHFDLPLQNL